jgi:hypothetical protein
MPSILLSQFKLTCLYIEAFLLILLYTLGEIRFTFDKLNQLGSVRALES